MKPNLLQEKFLKLDSLLRQKNSFLLVVHPSPDADALGSAFALQKYIASLTDKKTPKKTEIYSVNEPSENLKSLFNLKKISTDLNLSDKEVIIFLDRGDVYEKLDFPEKIKQLIQEPVIVNIDHHPQTNIKGALNIRAVSASSTSEIIFRFLEKMDFPLEPEIAQYLLNGIWFDTGGFKHNNTSPEVLEIAGQLVRKGASIGKVYRALSADKSVNVLKLWGLAIERVRINKKTGMAVSYLTKKDLEKYNVSVQELDSSKLSELLNTIADTKFSLMLTEREGNKIKASLRSEVYKKVDVAKIAQMFNGGGHKLASGFEIEGKIKTTKNGLLIE